MSKSWITPEEMEEKRERNRRLMLVALPLLAVLFGGGVTYLISGM